MDIQNKFKDIKGYSRMLEDIKGNWRILKGLAHSVSKQPSIQAAMQPSKQASKQPDSIDFYSREGGYLYIQYILCMQYIQYIQYRRFEGESIATRTGKSCLVFVFALRACVRAKLCEGPRVDLFRVLGLWPTPERTGRKPSIPTPGLGPRLGPRLGHKKGPRVGPRVPPSPPPNPPITLALLYG